MPICGWVMTLTGEDGPRQALLATLAGDPRLTLGEIQGARLPLVSETQGHGSVELLSEELSQLPGALFVDLAYADLSDVDQGGQGGVTRRPPRRQEDRS